MSALHHLLQRSAGATALMLALAVLMGSLCPRGWFVCVHDETMALVDGNHAVDGHHADGQDGCGERDCCPTGGAPGADCLDLALSLVLDDQTIVSPVWTALPAGTVLASLPDLTAAASRGSVPLRALIGGPPPSPFTTHIRLLV
jgi:hypothetical protein